MAVTVDGVLPLSAKAWRTPECALLLRCEQLGWPTIEVYAAVAV
jgi:hypothetical protein